MAKNSTKVSSKQVITAIKGTAGVKAQIARKLGVTRKTVDSYLKRWPTAKAAYDEEKSGIDDAALSVVINDIVKNHDVGTAKWWLVKKVEGFGEKTRLLTWQDEVIDALKSGEVKPADIQLLYPDLAGEFFARAGVSVGSD